MWDDLKGLIGVVAPTIGTALGGPVGGMAAKVLTDALGLSDGAKPKDILKAIQGDPDALLRIKEAENAFEIRMREIDVDVFKIDADDRNSARQREMVVKDRTPAIIGTLTVLCFFGFIGYASFVPSSVVEGRMDFIMLAIGWLGGTATSVITYYFGSSKGSKDKTAALASMVGK
jgi:hypothetical protein